MVIQKPKSSMPIRSDKEERTDGLGSVHRGDCQTGVFDLGAEKGRKVRLGKNDR